MDKIEYSPTLSPPSANTTITVHSPLEESGKTPDKRNRMDSQSSTSSICWPLPSAPRHEIRSVPEANIITLDGTTQDCVSSDTPLQNGTGLVYDSPVNSIHKSQDADEIISLSSDEETAYPSFNHNITSPDWNISQWEDLYAVKFVCILLNQVKCELISNNIIGFFPLISIPLGLNKITMFCKDNFIQ